MIKVVHIFGMSAFCRDQVGKKDVSFPWQGRGFALWQPQSCWPESEGPELHIILNSNVEAVWVTCLVGFPDPLERVNKATFHINLQTLLYTEQFMGEGVIP